MDPTTMEIKAVKEEEEAVEHEEHLFPVDKQGQSRQLLPYVWLAIGRTTRVGWVHIKPKKSIYTLVRREIILFCTVQISCLN